MSPLWRHWETGGVIKPCELTALPDIVALNGWRDLESVKRYMGLLQADRLTMAVEAAWSSQSAGS